MASSCDALVIGAGPNGLVTAALARYDGAIIVEPGGDDWAKSVVVRFFRAYVDDE